MRLQRAATPCRICGGQSGSEKVWLLLLHNHSSTTWWRSWLRHCATSRKVRGSIPDCVIAIFHWHNPFGRSMALRSTQLLKEMSTRNISLGGKGCRCVDLTTFICRLSTNSRSLILLEPSRPVMGLLYLYFHHLMDGQWAHFRPPIHRGTISAYRVTSTIHIIHTYIHTYIQLRVFSTSILYRAKRLASRSGRFTLWKRIPGTHRIRSWPRSTFSLGGEEKRIVPPILGIESSDVQPVTCLKPTELPRPTKYQTVPKSLNSSDAS